MFKSVAGQMSQTLKTILKLCHHCDYKCPKCGHMTVVQPGPIDKDTGHYEVAPVCAYPGCHWRQNAEAYTRRHRKEATSRAKQMRYSSAIGYFMQYSVQSDTRDLQHKTFKTFNVGMNHYRKKVAQEAKKISGYIADGQPVHSLLVGQTGTGKTHLAYGIVNDVLEKTSYRKKIVFLNMLNLSVLQKKAITDIPTRKWFNSLLSQIDEADLVVLDDLGRERLNRWNQMIVALIAGDRTNKSLLITSNLENGLERYSQQIQDRLIPNDRYSIVFDGLTSYRPKASKDAIKEKQPDSNLPF